MNWWQMSLTPSRTRRLVISLAQKLCSILLGEMNLQSASLLGSLGTWVLDFLIQYLLCVVVHSEIYSAANDSFNYVQRGIA